MLTFGDLLLRVGVAALDRGFHERGGDDLVGAVALPVVGYGRGVRGEVPAELAYRLGEFVLPVLVLLATGVLVFEVGGDVVGLQRAEDVAVPQKPFQPFQLGGEGDRHLGWTRRPLASCIITVIRIVMWNQSSRCSACGSR